MGSNGWACAKGIFTAAPAVVEEAGRLSASDLKRGSIDNMRTQQASTCNMMRMQMQQTFPKQLSYELRDLHEFTVCGGLHIELLPGM